MARLDVKSFQKIEKSKNTVHSKVSATYSVFENEGEKYLQVDTYGKDERAHPGKLSQTIQVDKETAKLLVKLLIDEFDLLS